MRISCDENDDGYIKPITGIEIRFNGEIITGVITADEEAGYILRYQRMDGVFVLNGDKTEILTEKLCGKVEVIMPLIRA